MKNQPLEFLDFVGIEKYLLENMGLPLELNLLLKKQQKVEVLKNLLSYQHVHLGYNFFLLAILKFKIVLILSYSGIKISLLPT